MIKAAPANAKRRILDANLIVLLSIDLEKWI